MFTDINAGEHLHIVNLEREHVAKIEGNFNELFLRKFTEAGFLNEIKNNRVSLFSTKITKTSCSGSSRLC